MLSTGKLHQEGLGQYGNIVFYPKIPIFAFPCGYVEIGRQARLRILCLVRVGSSPTTRTRGPLRKEAVLFRFHVKARRQAVEIPTFRMVSGL